MSHGITGADHLVSGRSMRPWHGLGTTVRGTLTAGEALRQAHLDWNVALKRLQMEECGFHRIPVPAYAVVRDDTKALLGVVGNRYVPIQNSELVAILDVVLEFGARIDTAGSLLGGRFVWFSALLDEFDAAGEAHQEYLVVSHAHDGSRAVSIRRTTVRVVCWNTLQLHDRAASASFSVRHTSSARERVAVVGRVMRSATAEREKFRETAERLARARLSEKQQIDFLLETLGLDPELELASVRRKIEAATAALEWERRHTEADPDSVWTSLQGVTSYLSHERATRGSGTYLGKQRRLISVLAGDRARRASDAYHKAVRLADHQRVPTPV